MLVSRIEESWESDFKLEAENNTLLLEKYHKELENQD